MQLYVFRDWFDIVAAVFASDLVTALHYVFQKMQISITNICDTRIEYTYVSDGKIYQDECTYTVYPVKEGSVF